VQVPQFGDSNALKAVVEAQFKTKTMEQWTKVRLLQCS
jgi:hypothetical protein